MTDTESPSAEATVDCTRCKTNGPVATNVVYGGALGDDIRANTCNRCWQEWLGMEVMVINELRLNFMDPEAQKTLITHMREFLKLDAA